MQKRMIASALALAMVLGVAGTSFAARVKCTVDAVDGDKVTMTCEKADKMKAGDEVKVSLPSKSGAIEGC
ncbi:MAG: selenite/tellurite reduction operon protein ExtJ [Desulfopila sp.]